MKKINNFKILGSVFKLSVKSLRFWTKIIRKTNYTKNSVFKKNRYPDYKLAQFNIKNRKEYKNKQTKNIRAYARSVYQTLVRRN